MSQRPSMKATNRILEQFPQLTPSLQQAARYLVDHPSDVVITSMRQLADNAGVRPATLSRLAQRLGFEGWANLKDEFAKDLGLAGQSYGERAQRLVRRKQGRAEADIFAPHHQNLVETRALLSQDLAQACEILEKARVVHIAGFRASFAIAFTFFYGYRLFRNSVELIDGHSGGLELHLRRVRKSDVVVLIGFAPYSRESQLVARSAHEREAGLLTITDSVASPLATNAELNLPFTVETPSFFPSVAAGVATVEVLLEMLVARGKRAAVRPLDQAERQLVEFGAYLSSDGET